MLRGCIPILMLTAALVQAQQSSLSSLPAGGVSIPVELTTTVRAESARRGDTVAFRTLEAVLIANGLVMPTNAKLTGRIVGAAPRQGDKPSWLVLLVERAEWKKQTVPLHAFISAQISISSVTNQNPDPATSMPPTTSPRRAARESGRVAVQGGVDVPSSTRLPQDASSSSQPDYAAKPALAKDLRIVRDKDGITYLFSSQSNVKLPSGVLLMLQNEPATAINESGAADSRPSAPPQ